MRAGIRNGFLVFFAVAMGVAVPAEAQPPQNDSPVVIFLVRHAEKAMDDPDDPTLTEAGRERSAALAAMLRDAGVTHLYATQFRRTRETIAGLAEATRVDVTVIEAARSIEQAEALKNLPGGSVAVVVGHSNTIPALVRRLGGAPTGTFDHPVHGETLTGEPFDRMFQLIRFADTAPKLIEMRYGRPNPGAPAPGLRPDE